MFDQQGGGGDGIGLFSRGSDIVTQYVVPTLGVVLVLYYRLVIH